MNGSLYYNLLYAFTPRKKQLIARLAVNTLKAKLFSKRVLRYVDISVTVKCDLECKHCFAKSFDKDGEVPLSIEEWKNVAHQCMKLGSSSFGITGGNRLFTKI